MLPKISYHGGHSGELCDHAQDTKRQILRAYEQQGFTHVGVSEHLPPEDDRFLYPDERMLGHDAAFLCGRFERYFDVEVPKLRKEFQSTTQFLFGFETEFYGAKPIERLLSAVNRYKPDYLVLSLHHVDDIPIDFDLEHYERALRHCGSHEALMLRYYDQQLELIQGLGHLSSEMPLVLGHMDLITLFAPRSFITQSTHEAILRNIEAARHADIVFEVNARSFKKGLSQPYPALPVIQEIKEQGGLLTLGDDSHAVSEVGLFYPALEEVLKEDCCEFCCVQVDDFGRYRWIRHSSAE